MTDPVRRISLGLQGGGSHGAFTWGVLDRILDERGLEIAAVSGTSAGAMNAAALKAGMIADGRAGAKAALAALWSQIEAASETAPDWAQPGVDMFNAWTRAFWSLFPFSPAGIMGQVWSPYSSGLAWENPLAPVVRGFDFSNICAAGGPQIFISATNVRSGRIRVFRNEEITPDVILASACLPTLFQAVEIDGDSYWDGGYAGNPALFPMFAPDLPDDIVVVSINPLRREEVPETPIAIQDRINEISFNASLMRELRAIAFVKRLIADGSVKRGAMKDVLLHIVSDDALMLGLGADSKLLPNPRLISRLREAGFAAADLFLAQHGDKIGRESSVDASTLIG